MYKRIIAGFALEFKMQLRNGFTAAVSFVALLWIVLLKVLPGSLILPMLPVVIFTNLMITSFYFMAAQVLLDKEHGVLAAIAVTPLRIPEQLGVRMTSLALLATAENLAVVWGALGFSALPITAIPAILSIALFYTVFAYLTVLRYDNVSSFLMPSFLYTLVLILPIFSWFGWLPEMLIWLHPMGWGLQWLSDTSLGETQVTTFIFAVLSVTTWLLLLSLAAKQHFLLISQRAGESA